jgi:alkylated DNA repair dioxygenase AlkB
MPAGITYFDTWLAPAEGAEVLHTIESFDPSAWNEVLFRGVIAKRRAIYFGHDYDTTSRKSKSIGPMPEWLSKLARRAETAAGLEPRAFAAALLWRYPEGSGIGWHRDAPAFGNTVVSISLGATGRMQFRRDRGGQELEDNKYELQLQPNSLVIIQDEARYNWQHRVVPVKTTRYSITLRNLKVRSSRSKP